MSKEMEDKLHGAKKNSLHALHKLMKDLHHKALGKSMDESKEPHEAHLEVDIQHSPYSVSEHDEENKGEGVDPFDDSQMEGDQAAELAEHSPEVEASEHEAEPEEDEDNSDLKLPAGIHEMLMHHLKNKK